MARPQTRSQTKREADQATQDGLKWAPNTRQFDFTLEAKEGFKIQCHKSLLKDNSPYFKDYFRKPSNTSLMFVPYHPQTVKAFVDYLYNNNLSVATPELWTMGLEFGVKSLISDLIQCFTKSPNKVEIWRQVFQTENNEPRVNVAMWVKNLALDNLMKAFGPDIDTIYSSPKKIHEFFRYVYVDLFPSDPHAADDVKRVAHGRARAKLRTIQAQVEPNPKKIKMALKVVDKCCHE